MDKLILVYYVSVSGLDNDQIERFMKEVSKKITSNKIDAETILIPVLSETRIECINPKYITEEELILKHNSLIKELNEKLTEQLEILKEQK